LDWAARIRAYRDTHGLSQERLAVKLGTDQGTVSRLETGRRPTAKTIRKLNSILQPEPLPALSDGLLKFLLELTPMMIVVSDIEAQKIVAVSRAHQQFWRYETADVVGRDMWALNPPEITEWLLETFGTPIFPADCLVGRQDIQRLAEDDAVNRSGADFHIRNYLSRSIRLDGRLLRIAICAPLSPGAIHLGPAYDDGISPVDLANDLSPDQLRLLQAIKRGS
jgi:transcriptional regulator with XRE-family HTH domain